MIRGLLNTPNFEAYLRSSDGHVHGKMPGIGRQMDVGVDTNGFYPYSWEEIKERLSVVPIYQNGEAVS